MAYNIPLTERETIVRWDAAEQVAHIWTCDPIYLRKLDKLVAELPETYKCTKRDDVSAWYETSAKNIKFGKPRAPHELSEAQREVLKRGAENLRKLRNNKAD